MEHEANTLSTVHVTARRNEALFLHGVASTRHALNETPLHHVVTVLGPISVHIIVSIVPVDANLGLTLRSLAHALVLLPLPLLPTHHRALATAALVAPLPVRASNHAVARLQQRVEN